MVAAGRPVTRLGAVPRAIAPPMASKDRNEEYARLKAEFDTMQAEMGVPGQRRRSPVCGESRASPSARSWPPSGKCCPGLRSRTTSTSLARRAE